MSNIKPRLVATPATRMLQITVAICSLIFTIGTTLHNFAIINPAVIERMMQQAGTANPAEEGR